jgi:16S rRNA (cytosine967-C5)-methyltransferase
MGQALENHAAAVLRRVQSGEPADAALRAYLSAGRGLGAEDRRAVSRAVFAHCRWAGWLDPKEPLQAQVLGALELAGRFLKQPSSIKPEALAARSVPGWLASEMELTPAFLRSIQGEPPVWIRAKVGRAEEVALELGHAEPAVLPASLLAPPGLSALRYNGDDDLHRAHAFRAGAFEIQDLASQLVGHCCEPGASGTWWDACAGEGGKALHLSDLMRNKGLVWATDRSARRLEALKGRAARAGMFNYRAAAWTGQGPAPFRTRCDGVLVDAPCSGVGTWRRNPHARWTTSLSDVRELAAVQARLLRFASASVRPGGRLVYSVCTLTRSETTSVADAFAAENASFEPAPIALAGGASRVTLLPQDLDANGMFVAAWRRVR